MPYRYGHIFQDAPPSILFVDDDEDLHVLLRDFMGERGIEVTVAFTAESAMEIYSRNSFDILLVDINLPDANGNDFFEELRSKYPDVTGIVLTGNPNLDGAIRAINEPGIVAYESKPFDIFRLYSIVREAISRKRTEVKLRESELRYREFVENFRGIAFEMDPSGKLLILHGAVQEISGYSDKALMSGKPSWLDLVHPDFKSMVSYGEIETDTMAVFDEREYVIVRKDGSPRWIYETLQYVRRADSSLDKIRGAIFDITRSRESDMAVLESERKHQDFLESLDDIVWSVDAMSGKLVYANKAVEKVYDCTIEEFFQDNNKWFSMVHPDDRDKVEEYSKSFHNKELSNIEYRILAKNGSVRWVYDRPTRIFDKDGNMTHFGGVMSDITRQKMAEMEKEDLRNQLAQAQKMDAIGQLAAGIAHDFNNILAAVMGNSSYAMSIMKESAPGYAQFREILNASNIAKSLISKLLSFAREDRPDIASVSIYSVINDLLEILNVTKPSNISIDLNIAEGIPPLKIDRTQVLQSLLNVCNNARDAMVDGGVIAISARNVKGNDRLLSRFPDLAPGKYCVIEISDTGHGIPQNIIGNIFDPFFTTKDVDKGTGLGLSVTLGIIKANGGEITVQSKEGRGAAFKLYLPLVDKDVKIDAKALKNKFILIGDTDLKNLIKAEAALTKDGFKVIAESDPEKIMNIVMSKTPDITLAIIDAAMTAGNGAALYKAISEAAPDIRIALFSNFDLNALKMDFVAAGIYGILPKPFKSKDLCEKALNILASSGQRKKK